ncbi:MAG: phosphogluconate dehydratase [Burkholderiaceae bacterium]
MNETVTMVTRRIQERSRDSRSHYLAIVKDAASRPPNRDAAGCANLAHAWAALPAKDRLSIRVDKAPNLAVVTAYNDMLSAHQPYAGYPEVLRDEARRQGATTQVAGGVPAMCDGITQGMPGMELSLFSRDVIAMSTAIALSHDMFDGALLLGICDKIVPGLLIGALHFGHLPCVFVPAGPMPSGLPNKEKAAVREAFARGEASRDELLDAELSAYHSPGTCTFYGTANSNQMLLEAMGLHVPNAAFEPPGSSKREALTRLAVTTVLEIGRNKRYTPIGRLVDERCIVNALVALLATGGSTNHLIHWVAVAAAAGIKINWDDFDDLSAVVPLLTRIYPNGSADVNDFQAAGGPVFVLKELAAAGLMHADVNTVVEGGMQTVCKSARQHTGDPAVLRSAAEPFSPHGGLRLLAGNLGRAVIKVSAIAEDRHVIKAPARVFDSQQEFLDAFNNNEMNHDMVAVVRFQGPRANGMPELHKLTPPLGVLQSRGLRVGLVTDGRMSGASGNVPAAIHVTPESIDNGPLARVRDGDMIVLDAVNGELDALVSPEEWAKREQQMPNKTSPSSFGYGRELFAGFRQRASGAEQGASTWM